MEREGSYAFCEVAACDVNTAFWCDAGEAVCNGGMVAEGFFDLWEVS
jgi:hypothetical protein